MTKRITGIIDGKMIKTIFFIKIFHSVLKSHIFQLEDAQTDYFEDKYGSAVIFRAIHVINSRKLALFAGEKSESVKRN